MLIDAAFALRFLDHGHDLVFRNRKRGILLEELGHELSPERKQRGERREDHHEEADDADHTHGVAVRKIFSEKFRCDFAENEDDDRHDDRRYRCGKTCVAPNKGRKEKRCNGGCGNVYDVVADKHGRQEFFVILLHLHNGFGFFVAVSGKGFHTGFVETRKGCFGS